VERLEHYFAAYKILPGRSPQVSIQGIYHASHARQVVTAAIEDYQETFAAPA
jgi:inorganic pyrophosphatase